MASPAPASESSAQSSVSKDEVGWMFVKKFYTVLNQDPNKLHKFYTKQSSLSHGIEGEIAQTFVGQRAIHDKIQSLGFKDCLVMLSSVDSLASLNGGIVIQVLGELSNHHAPSQKFAQTFFLAEQPAGYFVLNDIFRYIKEDIESDFEEADPDSANEIDTPMLHESQHGPNGLTNGFHSATHSLIAEESPSGLDSMQYPAATVEPQPDSRREIEPVDGTAEDAPVEVLKESEITLETESGAFLETSNPPSHDTQIDEPESTEQGPTLKSATKVAQEGDTPEQNLTSPVAPLIAAPKTWASLAATNADRWHAQPEPRAQAPVRAPVTAAKGNGTQPSARKEVSKSEKQDQALGYIKHVGSKVQKSTLNDALVKFGQLKDLDINRQKSCGFVEFSTHASLQAAIAAGPIDIGDNVKIVVEERRKTGKNVDRNPKQLTGDRKTGKAEETRAPAPKKGGRGASGSAAQKSRAD